MESKAAKDEKGIQPDSTPKIIYLTDEARAQRIVKCPYCGEEVSTEAKKCDHCGRQLEISTDSAERALQDRGVNFDSLGYIKSALASKYQVLEEIAKTDTSTVFRAIHLQLRREVALKVLLKNIAQDRDFTDRFHRRARAIDRLSQNNIITILDEGVETGVHYLAMEFLKGIDLQRKISEDGPVTPEELINILLPAIGGLGHAHSNGILHGNLKCSSIFLHDDGRIILFGFGIPHLTKGNLLSFKRDSNSIEYLSPEEASGKSVDGRSDIYSLGVVMYYALTGRFPYTGLDSGSTITAIISHQYVPINTLRPVPQWLEKIVDRCLQRDISKRVQSCAELLASINVRPAAKSTQTGSSGQPSREAKSNESPKEKSVDVRPPKLQETTKPTTGREMPSMSGVGNRPKGKKLPSDEGPAEDESLAEEQMVEFTDSEESPTKEERSSPKTKVMMEQPAKSEPKDERKSGKKTKSKVLVWIVGFAILGFVSAALILVVMNRSTSINESAVSESEQKRVQTTNEHSNQTVDSQGNAGNAIQNPSQNVNQAEPSASALQEKSPSVENNTSTPAQVVLKPEGTPSGEKNTPATLKAVSKGKASSGRQATGTPANKATSEENETITAPAPAVVQLVTVPDLTGTQLNVAKSILSLNGLKVGAVSTIPDPANDGMVMRQVPKPGTQLKKGSMVNLILGSK